MKDEAKNTENRLAAALSQLSQQTHPRTQLETDLLEGSGSSDDVATSHSRRKKPLKQKGKPQPVPPASLHEVSADALPDSKSAKKINQGTNSTVSQDILPAINVDVSDWAEAACAEPCQQNDDTSTSYATTSDLGACQTGATSWTI